MGGVGGGVGSGAASPAHGRRRGGAADLAEKGSHVLVADGLDNVLEVAARATCRVGGGASMARLGGCSWRAASGRPPVGRVVSGGALLVVPA